MSTFKRNQVEEAISKILEPRSPKPSSGLRTRLKRLFDTDRALEPREDPRAAKGAQFAFFSGEPPGTGKEVWHSEYEAFALAVALLLLQHGWPQVFVVMVMRRVRSKLEREHTRTLAQDRAWLFDQEAIRKKAQAGDMAFNNQDPVLLMLASKPSGLVGKEDGPDVCDIVRGEMEGSKVMAQHRAKSPCVWTSFEVVGIAHSLSDALARTRPHKRGRS
jgi:hypothetical protein